MDKFIESLFKKNDKDYVILTNHYLEKINKNVKNRGGKMVTASEMNEIYQEGGYFHYLGNNDHHSIIPGTNNINTPLFVVQSRDAPGIYGFGNDSGAVMPASNIIKNETTGDSPTLSYGINNTPCAGTDINYEKYKAAQLALEAAQSALDDTKNAQKPTEELDAAQSALETAKSHYDLVVSQNNSQCVNTSGCTRTYEVKEPPQSFFSKIWGSSDNNSVSCDKNTEKNTEKNTLSNSCAPPQTGGGKTEKKISDKDFNKLISNANFKMPKYQKIQFKKFIEYLMNQ